MYFYLLRMSQYDMKFKEKITTILSPVRTFVSNHKKHICIFFAGYIAVIAVIIAAPKIVAVALPYEIKVDDKTVCYVKNEESAKNVVQETYKTDLPEEAKLIKYSSNVGLSAEKANTFKAVTSIVSDEDAVEAVNNVLDNQNQGSVELSSTYILTHSEPYTPDPILKKDDKMLAGQERVEKEPVKGTVDVSTVYNVVNGEVINKEDINSTVTEEGVPGVVYRGTLGLPDDENWKTFDGDPIYKDGDELVTTAFNYIGAPYKHGGTSLKTGVSCVGFVRAIYKKYGIKIGNSHKAMETAGIGVSYKNARKGDIICYKGHVGLYIGNGKMLDATSKRGVGVNTVHPKSIIAVRRIVK